MSKSLVQFRVDKDIRDKASKICERFGFDLQTYLRMAMSSLILNNGVPFDLFAIDKTDPGYMAMRELQEEAKKNGTCNLTDEEINEEIALARKERMEKK